MRVLTVRQPYADAIVRWGKCCENRTWYPPRALVGTRIAIHASAPLPRRIDLATVQACAPRGVHPSAQAHDYVLGCVVGTVRLCGATDDYDEFRRLAGDAAASWWLGPVGWWLDEPHPLRVPVPVRGALGVWTLPADVARAVETQLERSLRAVSGV